MMGSILPAEDADVDLLAQKNHPPKYGKKTDKAKFC